MKSSLLNPHPHSLLRPDISAAAFTVPFLVRSSAFNRPTKPHSPPCLPPRLRTLSAQYPRPPSAIESQNITTKKESDCSSNGKSSRLVALGAVSIGVVLLMMGMEDDHHNRAWALGPEGPLVEEFWENVRRYALYALTVSTGAIYTVFQPIFELLKNPISAILVLVIIGGSIFIVSQILSAMVGISDFSYDYGY